MKPFRKYFLAIPTIVAITLAAAAIPFYKPFYVACLVANPNSDMTSKWVHLIMFSILPVGAAIVVSFVNMGAICRYVWITSRKAERWRLSAATSPRRSFDRGMSTDTLGASNDLGSSVHSSGSNGISARIERRQRRQGRRKNETQDAVFWQSFWYAVAFLLTWVFYIVGQFKPYFSSQDSVLYTFWIFMLISNPLMGFWNAFVYIKPWMYRRKRDRQSQTPRGSDNS